MTTKATFYMIVNTLIHRSIKLFIWVFKLCEIKSKKVDCVCNYFLPGKTKDRP